jgi:hypothetical protein
VHLNIFDELGNPDKVRVLFPANYCIRSNALRNRWAYSKNPQKRTLPFFRMRIQIGTWIPQRQLHRMVKTWIHIANITSLWRLMPIQYSIAA